MIFVTLGTHQQPFGRAVDALSQLDTRDEEMLIQRGSTPACHGLQHADWVEYLAWDKLAASMRRADVVVTHAGVGSAMTAISAGKKPIMMPRLARFGEHVDDHQVQLARRFGERGLALVCEPGQPLSELVDVARASHPAIVRSGRAELRRAVAASAAVLS